MFKINDVELELDLMDIDEKERFEECFETMNETVQEAVKNINEGDSESVYMRKICEAVMDFFDNLFGEGTSNEIFDGRVNIKKCMLAIQDITKEKVRQGKELNDIVKASSTIGVEDKLPNRAQRRAQGRVRK